MICLDMSSRSIFIIKPLIDLIHEEASHFTSEINELKKRVAELEKENESLRTSSKKQLVVPEVIDDATFAEEARAFHIQNNEENVIIHNTSEEKVVTVVDDAQKKEQKREYQRLYREKRKAALHKE